MQKHNKHHQIMPILVLIGPLSVLSQRPIPHPPQLSSGKIRHRSNVRTWQNATAPIIGCVVRNTKQLCKEKDAH